MTAQRIETYLMIVGVFGLAYGLMVAWAYWG